MAFNLPWKTSPTENWLSKLNGNFVWRTPDHLLYTVFYRNGYWKWVVEGRFSQEEYRDAEEAKVAAEEDYGYG